MPVNEDFHLHYLHEFGVERKPAASGYPLLGFFELERQYGLAYHWFALPYRFGFTRFVRIIPHRAILP